jgi:hypothetical protein
VASAVSPSLKSPKVYEKSHALAVLQEAQFNPSSGTESNLCEMRNDFAFDHRPERGAVNKFAEVEREAITTSDKLKREPAAQAQIVWL